MAVNDRPISLREGKVFLDGVEVMDMVKCDIIATPETWSGKLLGNRNQSTRWLGVTYKVNITRRRSTPWLRDAVMNYVKKGITPEFTVQGIQSDENSDYFDAYGSNTITARGCVLTGDISLVNLDTGGQVVEDAVSLVAYSVV